MSSHNQFQMAAQAAQEAKERAKRAEEEALAAAEAEAAALAAAEAANRLPDSHPPPIKFSFWQRMVNRGSSFLFLSILFHVLLLLGAAAYVVQTIRTKDKLKFNGAPKTLGAPGQKSLEYKVQTVKRNQTMSAPMAATRLTSTASNVKVAIPDAPAMTSSNAAMPSMIGGMGGTAFGSGAAAGAAGGTGAGMGVGGAMAAMPASGFTVFGFKGNSAARGLVGHLYDLKQTPDKKPTMYDVSDNGAALKFMMEFSQKKFDVKMLKPFFVAPVELMAARWWIPNMNVAEMPKAFGVEKDVRPTKMIAHYHGKVIPPKDGKYRFMAFGDDFFGIKFNGKVILPFERKGQRKYFSGEETEAFYDTTKNGHAMSDPVMLRSGQECEMDVFIAEWPGGLATFSLLVEREEDLPKYKKTPDGLPIIPIFETEITSEIPTYTGKPGLPTLLPPHDPNRLMWKVLKEAKEN